MIKFKKEDIISWSNAEQAEKYLDKNGLFAKYYSEDDNDNWEYGTLCNIDKNEIVSDIFEAYCANTDDYMGTYGLFIPEDKFTVTPYNKDGFRAFNSVEEFESVFKPKSIISVVFNQDGIESFVRVVYVKSEHDEDNVALFVPIKYNGNNKKLTDEEITELISDYNNRPLEFSYKFLFKTYRYRTDDGLKYFGIHE